jgi:hypothetical protein
MAGVLAQKDRLVLVSNNKQVTSLVRSCTICKMQDSGERHNVCGENLYTKRNMATDIFVR